MKKIFISTILFPILLIISLFYYPKILINSFMLENARKYLLNETVDWNSLEVNIENKGLLEKKISFSSSDLSLNTNFLSGKFNSISIITQISFLPLEIKSVSKLDIISNGLKKTPAVSKNKTFSLNIPDSNLSFKKIEKILNTPANIHIKNLLVDGSHFSFSIKHKKNNLSTGLNIDLTALIDSKVNHLNGKFNLDHDQNEINSEIKLETGKNKFSKRLKISSDQTISGHFALKNDIQRLDADIKGEFTKKDINTTIDFDFLSVNPPLNIKSSSCKILMSKASNEKIEIATECNLPTFISQKDLDKDFTKLISEYFDIQVNNRIVVTNDTTGAILKSSNRINIKDSKKNQIRINGHLNIDTISYMYNGFQTEFKTQSNLVMNSPEIEKLIKKLEYSYLAIPAPFNQLSGNVECRLGDQLAKMNKNNVLYLKCNSDLKSQGQQYLLDANLALYPPNKQRHKVKINGEVEIKHLLFTMPNISLNDEMPKLSIDNRFILEDSEKNHEKLKPSQATWLDYDIHLSTGRKDSIKIQSNLLDSRAPLALDVHLKNGKEPIGYARIMNHKVELMRRKALIEKIEMKLLENGAQELDGRILFDNNDYKIFLNISGSPDKPYFAFESKPYLSENDIIAILIFGIKQSELDEESLMTVEDAKSAAMGQAISLLSMYYLVSTPVEKVSYNPQDGLFSAKIKVAQGTSINLGKNTGNKRLAKLRQVLGSNWIFETAYLQDENAKGRYVTMLKWIKKY